jgi:hypothetical protein
VESELTTVSVAEFDLGAQAWAGEDEFDPGRVTRPWRTAGPCAKPVDGFFTSSWDGPSSAWLDYMRAERMRSEEARSGLGSSLWLLVPQPDAALYVIDSEEDYRRLTNACPQDWNDPNVKVSAPAPNWHRIAGAETTIDGVHLTERAAASARAGEDLLPLRDWAVESTLWFAGRLTLQDCLGALRDDWTLASKDDQR